MNYEYDIAISFAGEDRLVAQQIATLLKANGVKVFYDEFEEANLWGEDLYIHLHDVYSKEARFCIMLLSVHYAKKAWTNHERQSAQERAFKESQPYILPVRLDETIIPGIRETIGYISLKNKTIEDVVRFALSKIEMSPTTQLTAPQATTGPSLAIPLPKIKRDFTERDKDVFLENTFATIHTYFQEGIKQLNDVADIEADFKDINTTKFLCKVYVHGKRKSSCTIWYGGQSLDSGIKYSSEANPDASNSMNEILAIEVRNGALMVKPLMNMYGSRESYLNEESAANYLWSKLIEPINR